MLFIVRKSHFLFQGSERAKEDEPGQQLAEGGYRARRLCRAFPGTPTRHLPKARNHAKGLRLGFG